jgi:hypothetical protein
MMLLPDFDNMSDGEILEYGEDLFRYISELSRIRRTLIENCKPDAALRKLGITYYKKGSVLNNLTYILRKLLDAADAAKSDQRINKTLVQRQVVRIAYLESRLNQRDEQVTEQKKEIERLNAYADKLAAGFPVGMLPKDVENLKEANAALADENQELRIAVDEIKKWCLGLEKS